MNLRASEGPAVLLAPAKVTLSLRIVGQRHDGYHLIESEMVSVDFYDELFVDPAGVGVRYRGLGTEEIPTDGTDLVSRALAISGMRASVVVDKHIPPGSGLGGGSSDAAAILRWTGFGDLDGAASLGADVPFCLVGGRARVHGIGEFIDPIPHRPESYTLIIPPLRVSTPAVYRAWDELGGPRASGPNDLEPAAIAVEPELGVWKDRIREAAGVEPVLAGSGATWFLAGSDHADALDAALDGARVIPVNTLAGSEDEP